MTTQPEDPKDLLKRELKEFGEQRIAWYGGSAKSFVDWVLKKDIVMFAARGVRTAEEFVEEAFRALESSSEEGVMGTRWQSIIAGLAVDTLDTGDLTTERDNALWVCELKAQPNTTNSSSAVQELRDLKRRTEEVGRYRRAKRKIPVKSAFCVLRGPEVDETKRFTPARPGENEDLRGFEYRYISGKALWRWLTGHETPLELLGSIDKGEADKIRTARQDCLDRTKAEMLSRLKAAGLGTSIEDVLKLI